MKNKLEQILNIDTKELNKKGRKAKNFVLKNKNKNIQSKLILDFVSRE